MNTRILMLGLSIVVLSLPSATLAQTDVFGLEIIAGMYDPMNASESYKEVYSGPGPLVGLGGYWLHAQGWSLEARGEYFFVSGNRTKVAGGDTDYGEDLALISILASGRYHFLRDRSISPYVLGGLGYYSLDVKSDAPDSDVNSSSAGVHAGAGVDFFVGTPVNVALEARYSLIPDLIGEGGLSAYYDETDFGGLAILAKISFVFGLE